MDSTQLTSSPPTQTLIKQLASCNKSTRDKALKLLKLYLQSQQQVSQDELKKIWKGLFFTVWHADKAQVQSDLINSLSCLVYKLPLLLSVEYLSVFFITMRREWTGIDGHRLDKFYLLIRRFVNACFVVMKRNNWDLGVVRRFVEVLENRVFFAEDGKGNGVNYHVASVFLDEFKGFVPVRKEVSWVLFGVLFEVMGKCSDKVLIGKIRSNVFEVLVEKGRELLERKKVGEEVEDETVRVGSLALSMGFAEKFFELGSSAECVQVNRKVLFGYHEEFLKLEKDFEVSGVEISVADGGIEDDEVVPDLIPIGSVENGVKMSGEMVNGASVSKGSKKKKKVKEVDGSGKKKKKVVLSEKEDEDMVIANGSDSVNETASDGINGTNTELIPNSGEMENGTSVSKSSKKKKKVKKDSDGSSKKKKKNVVSSENKDDDMVIANGLDSVNEPANNENLIDFNESVVSNLRMQFEKVATEVGLDKDGSSSLDSPEVPIALISKKRKRARSADGKKKKKPDFTSLEEKDAGAETSEKSAKKVRFSIKNNIVWKPHSPMPPQEMRLPPSVTPRGSALKKGLSPGPIREMPPATKKPVLKKKGVRGNKRVAPAVRRLRKMQGLIA
ncbi:ribosomal RNA processing protein 1-like [Heracleum sosnowskyi]|uniref:Ribosomal RNA processing protein 1-like n=1 Tax=Heracleum sosnowskyi TaxID=360622 RepID=A0AAD8N8E1_9APIA|nr:ribosomal RNA processing protein 1-like [Heracleum sosnowskyi]